MADEKKKSKKHNSVKEYAKPVISFVLASLVIIIPLCLVLLNVSVNLVHKAQQRFTPVLSDYSVSEEFTPSELTEGTVQINEPNGFDRIGELSCSKAGLDVSVYYGNNRVAYRSGAGLSTNYALPGTGGSVKVSANASGGFKALYNVKSGDVLTFVTSWGVYKYKVTDISLGRAIPESDGETLYLTTAPSKSAFSAFSGDKLIVSAALVSGPAAEEVRQ